MTSDHSPLPGQPYGVGDNEAADRGRPLSILMLGLRGMPDIQGGVERHVEELAPRLAALGCRVEVLARQRYLANKEPYRWRNVAITPLSAPRARSLEALVHTGRGVLYAARRRPDLIHIHAIGPALLTPLARLLGLRVVITHHGFDYERAKWGATARLALRAGEWMGVRLAAARIGVSESITASVRRRFGVEIMTIPNGVSWGEGPASAGALAQFGLEPGRYIVMVARLVPEKRHLDLIQAFARAAPVGWRLALVGGADHEDGYSRRVYDEARLVPGVVATGFQAGAALKELVAHAGLFVLPSSYEGLPIALLEALSFGVAVLASDISANREVGLAEDRYFPVGDVERLAVLLAEASSRVTVNEERDAIRARIIANHNWDRIAAQTLELYRDVAAGGASVRVPRRAPEGSSI